MTLAAYRRPVWRFHAVGLAVVALLSLAGWLLGVWIVRAVFHVLAGAGLPPILGGG